jgi:hypothetical protein
MQSYVERLVKAPARVAMHQAEWKALLQSTLAVAKR